MEIVVQLLCVAGLAFAGVQLDGPFDLFAKIRNCIARIPLLGPFFYKVLHCPFCLGFWLSFIVYWMMNDVATTSLAGCVIWSFAGGMFNYLVHNYIFSVETND